MAIAYRSLYLYWEEVFFFLCLIHSCLIPCLFLQYSWRKEQGLWKLLQAIFRHISKEEYDQKWLKIAPFQKCL